MKKKLLIVNNYHQYEKQYWKDQKLVLGLDEAGRGCWAGPLVVAGCILPVNYQNDLIKDSKQLNEKQRFLLAKQIKKDALTYEIVCFSSKEVDQLNPKHASILGMEQITKKIKLKPDVVLIDAEKIKTNLPSISLIHGDSLSISIAAASILAKTYRDQIMFDLDQQYPEYGFSKHKGYGTVLHSNILNKKGPITNVHRFSYRPIKKLLVK